MTYEQVQRLTTELAAAEATVVKLRTERDTAINNAFRNEHVPIRHLARATGLTTARISKLLGHPYKKRGRPTTPAPPAPAPAPAPHPITQASA